MKAPLTNEYTDINLKDVSSSQQHSSTSKNIIVNKEPKSLQGPSSVHISQNNYITQRIDDANANANAVTMKNNGKDIPFNVNLQQSEPDEEEEEDKEDENHGNSIDRFILLDQKDINLVTTEDTITSILPSLPAKINNASPSKIYTEAGFDKQLFQFPLIPVLIVTSSLAVTILVYISVVICGRFQNKRSDSIGSSNSETTKVESMKMQPSPKRS